MPQAVKLPDAVPLGTSFTFYDSKGRKSVEADIYGVVTRYEYNNADQKVEQYKYANRSALVGYFTAPGQGSTPPELLALLPTESLTADQQTVYDYDQQGWLIKQTVTGDLTTTEDDRETRYFYDANGNQTRIKGARGHSSYMVYDQAQRKVADIDPNGFFTRSTLDGVGNVITESIGERVRQTDAPITYRMDINTTSAEIQFTHPDVSEQKTIYYRRKGSNGDFASNTSSDVTGLRMTNLESGVEYEFYIEYGLKTDNGTEVEFTSMDSFVTQSTVTNQYFDMGYGSPSRSDGLRFVDGMWEARLKFTMTSPDEFHAPHAVSVSVGNGTVGSFSLSNAQQFSVEELSGKHEYAVVLRFDNTGNQRYQINWTDAQGRGVSTALADIGGSREVWTGEYEYHWKERERDESNGGEYTWIGDEVWVRYTDDHPGGNWHPFENLATYRKEIKVREPVLHTSLVNQPTQDLSFGDPVEIEQHNASGKIHNVYDDNNRLLFSNRNRHWERYFYNERGEMVRTVGFRWSSDSGRFGTTFLDEAVAFDSPPSKAELETRFAAAMNEHNNPADPDNKRDTIIDTRYFYNDAGQKVREEIETDTHGVVATEWVYDGFGNVVEEYVNKGIDQKERSTRYVYDKHNHIVSKQVGFTAASNFAYKDSYDQTEKNSSVAGQAVTETYAYGQDGVQTYSLDARGNEQRAQVKQGRVVSQWDGRESVVDGDHDDSKLQTSYGYDHFGRMTSKTEQAINESSEVSDKGVNYKRTEYVFDSFNQQVAYKVAAAAQGGQVHDAVMMEFVSYDKSGNRIAVTDANGLAIIHSNDVGYQDQRELLLRNHLNEPGQNVRNADNLTPEQRQLLLKLYTRYNRYNGANQMIASLDNVAGETTYRYDHTGNVLRETQNGITTRYERDVFGNVTSVQKSWLAENTVKQKAGFFDGTPADEFASTTAILSRKDSFGVVAEQAQYTEHFAAVEVRFGEDELGPKYLYNSGATVTGSSALANDGNFYSETANRRYHP